ncbi:MAG: hypothetical protein KJ718_03505 [Nanoarchaeota archaeon]|nr:hypothetical protein [Nanoarchaeota archaeon]MBU1051596.1 hypothetical protein [Nanoarchaeota archaeon]MBU1988903.1 hypothetical protein [Nanoarchaeota archaeon]
MKRNTKKGQIWIETVLYTLIGLALIGLVLAIATPKINKAKDRIVVEQTIESLGVWDEKINDVLDKSPGNMRVISAFAMKRGELYISPGEDKIFFVLDDLSEPYSEPGIVIEYGEIDLVSEQGAGSSSVRLTLDYTNVTNLTYSGTEELAKFTAASTPYSFSFENRGGVNITNVDIQQTN